MGSEENLLSLIWVNKIFSLNLKWKIWVGKYKADAIETSYADVYLFWYDIFPN